MGGGEDMNVDSKNFPFYEYLKSEEKEDFDRSISVQIMQKGTKINTYENNLLGSFLIIDGRVRVFLNNDKAREIFLYSLGDGDMCFLTESRSLGTILFDAGLQAETNTLICSIEHDVFQSIINNNSEVRAYVYGEMVERLSIFVINIQSVLFDSIEKRVADFILEQQIQLGSNMINKTQEEIAKNISSSTEVVCRTLRKFSRDGLLSYEKGTIKILDINGLKEI